MVLSDELEYYIEQLLKRMLIEDDDCQIPVHYLMRMFDLDHFQMWELLYDAGFTDLDNKREYVSARWRHGERSYINHTAPID